MEGWSLVQGLKAAEWSESRKKKTHCLVIIKSYSKFTHRCLTNVIYVKYVKYDSSFFGHFHEFNKTTLDAMGVYFPRTRPGKRGRLVTQSQRQTGSIPGEADYQRHKRAVQSSRETRASLGQIQIGWSGRKHVESLLLLLLLLCVMAVYSPGFRALPPPSESALEPEIRQLQA